MIDPEGYRPNVGIVLCNEHGKLFWARRRGMPDSWQFPQGGIKWGETAKEALFRELYEEIGLSKRDVRILGRTRRWLHYRLPPRFIRRDTHPICIGQKQIWFLLQLRASPERIRFDCTDHPEFDRWRWVDYWQPLEEVIYFKREVYRKALLELAPKMPVQVAEPPEFLRLR